MGNVTRARLPRQISTGLLASACLLLTCQTPALAQSILIGDGPAITTYSGLPQANTASGASTYAPLGYATPRIPLWLPSIGNLQATTQVGSNNVSAQFASGFANSTAAYQYGTKGFVYNNVLSTAGSQIGTLQYGNNNSSASVIAGGSGDTISTVQAGDNNNAKVLVWGSTKSNVGLVQVGNNLSRSVSIVGRGGVNVLVIQR